MVTVCSGFVFHTGTGWSAEEPISEETPPEEYGGGISFCSRQMRSKQYHPESCPDYSLGQLSHTSRAAIPISNALLFQVILKPLNGFRDIFRRQLVATVVELQLLGRTGNEFEELASFFFRVKIIISAH